MELRPYLKRIRIDWDSVEDSDGYPFSIPAIAAMDAVEFHPDVTFLVGDNGAGKSTLVEAIAVAMGFGPEGGTKNVRIQSADDVSPLSNFLKLEKTIFAFFMILLFINVEKPKEERKISVIYRQRVKKQDVKKEKFSQEVAKKKKLEPNC